MDLAAAKRLIEASPDFRLLQRVPAPRDWPLKAPSGETRRGVFVDTETTGLDPDADEVIELALLPFEYERDTGAIVRVETDAVLNAFRQPSFPIPPESSKIHGITDEMVKGQVIDPERIKAIIEPAHIVLAQRRLRPPDGGKALAHIRREALGLLVCRDRLEERRTGIS